MSQPQEFTQAEKEELFEELLHLYDLADDAVNTIGASTTKNRALQLELISPLIEQSNITNDTISQIYTEIAKEGQPVTPERKAALEQAFYTFFIALKKFSDDVEEKLLTGETTHA